MIEKKISCPNCKKNITITGNPLEKRIVVCPYCNTKGFFQFEDEIEKPKKIDVKSSITLSIYILISVLIIDSIFLFQTHDLFLILILIIVLSIFIVFRFDVRIILVYALFLLILTAFTFAFYNDEVYAKQLIINVYWLIVVSVVCYIVEALRKYC